MQQVQAVVDEVPKAVANVLNLLDRWVKCLGGFVGAAVGGMRGKDFGLPRSTRRYGSEDEHLHATCRTVTLAAFSFSISVNTAQHVWWEAEPAKVERGIDCAMDGRFSWLESLRPDHLTANATEPGGVFAFDNAGFYGSIAGQPLNGHITGHVRDGEWEWLLADGCEWRHLRLRKRTVRGSNPPFNAEEHGRGE